MTRPTQKMLNRIAVACDRLQTAGDGVADHEELWLQEIINRIDVDSLEKFADKKHAQYISSGASEFERLIDYKRNALKGGE